MKTLKIVCAAVLLASAMAVNSTVFAKERETGRGTGPVVFVTSQGLYYDSIVVVDSLPPNGRFQQLIPGVNGLETEYGPGEVGHLGGRWWIGRRAFDGGGTAPRDLKFHGSRCVFPTDQSPRR